MFSRRAKVCAYCEKPFTYHFLRHFLQCHQGLEPYEIVDGQDGEKVKVAYCPRNAKFKFDGTSLRDLESDAQSLLGRRERPFNQESFDYKS